MPATDKQRFNECQLNKQLIGVLSSEKALNVDICDVKIVISKNDTFKIYFNLEIVCILTVKSKTDDGFHMIATIAAITTIAEKKFSDRCDHMETTLQRS